MECRLERASREIRLGSGWLRCPSGCSGRVQDDKVLKLPGAFFAAPPPDQAHGGGGLLFGEDSLSGGEEGGLVGEIAAPLVAGDESVAEVVVEGEGSFFQVLVDAAEEAAILHVLGAGGEGELRVELVLGVGNAAGDDGGSGGLGGGGVLPEALDLVVCFNLERQFGSGLPGGITVEDVSAAVGSGTNGDEAEAGLDGDGSAIVGNGAVGMILAVIVIEGPGKVFLGLGGESE